jgi:malonyl-CoA/methylmalonyl-CoA synthetase
LVGKNIINKCLSFVFEDQLLNIFILCVTDKTSLFLSIQVLSNPYIQDKTRTRNAGCVGHPLPHYEVRITKPDEPNNILLEMRGLPDKGYWNPAALPVFETKPAPPQESAKPAETNNKIIGDLYVRSPGLFKEYWRRPEETAKEFVNGWFKTGDSASFEEGVFKILGRTSVDIIKTGGFKVSALEVETYLLEHENISDIAILGVPDETWGQHIAAVIVTKDGKDIELEDLKLWAVKKMASYAVPTMIRCVKALPRNAMGKVNKKELLKSVFADAPGYE